MLRHRPGRIFLLVAVVIFAAANAITRRLTELGESNLIEGRNPISFCNVLFVGNLTALITLLLVYHQQIRWPILRQISARDWLLLSVIAVLSGALAPALVFGALERTAVNNVILIGRIEPPLILGVSMLWLGERSNRWVILGALISFVGVVLTLLLGSPQGTSVTMAGVEIGSGDLLALAGAVASGVATVISQVSLSQIPIGVFSVYRTVIGTIFFAVTVVLLFGLSHFTDVFSPFVWRWMLVYGGVIIVGGQLAWFEGLRRTSGSEVSLVSSFSPIAGILSTYLILGDVPTEAQILGGLVILVGIGVNQYGLSQGSPAAAAQSRSRQEMISDVGFKGI